MELMKKAGLIIAITIIADILIFGNGGLLALAQNGPPPSGNDVSLLNPLCASGDPNCQNGTVAGLVQSIVNWLFIIATPIAVGMILIGAFQMIFAGGNEERFATGKKTILYTVIGYAIIFIGWGITSIIQSLLS
jgi:hypothetical protein